MSIVNSYKNHLGRYLAMATVVVVLGIGTGWYVSYRAHRTVAKIETKMQTVRDHTADRIGDVKDAGKNFLKKTGEKWRKILHKDTAQD